MSATDHAHRTRRPDSVLLTLQSLTGSVLQLLLDLVKPQRPREDEVTTAVRLLHRRPGSLSPCLLVAAGRRSPRPSLIHVLLAQGRHALVVLKDEQRYLSLGDDF